MFDGDEEGSSSNEGFLIALKRGHDIVKEKGNDKNFEEALSSGESIVKGDD